MCKQKVEHTATLQKLESQEVFMPQLYYTVKWDFAHLSFQHIILYQFDKRFTEDVVLLQVILTTKYIQT